MKKKPKYPPEQGGNVLLNSGAVVSNVQPLGRGRWQGELGTNRRCTFTTAVVVFASPLGVWHIALAMFQREQTKAAPKGWDVVEA